MDGGSRVLATTVCQGKVLRVSNARIVLVGAKKGVMVGFLVLKLLRGGVGSLHVPVSILLSELPV